MNPLSKWFYAISPSDTNTSRWFDRLLKVDSARGVVVAQWAEPGIFLTEADFIPRAQAQL